MVKPINGFGGVGEASRILSSTINQVLSVLCSYPLQECLRACVWRVRREANVFSVQNLEVLKVMPSAKALSY